MGHDHQLPAHRHAAASGPTLSLLRLSAGERIVGALAVLAALWGLVYAVLG